MATTKEPVKKVLHRSVTAAPAAHAAHAAHATPKAASHAAAPAATTTAAHKGRYTEAIGRRKTAVARVRITTGHGKILVNGKDLKGYFSLPRLMAAAVAPLEQLKLTGDFDVTVHVSGGGINAQAEAIRHGLSQAIVIKDAAWKPRLRAMGYMTRDSRMVERKKYGLKKARRAPQWAKR
jgi:small subunit ribosomal protein S9